MSKVSESIGWQIERASGQIARASAGCSGGSLCHGRKFAERNTRPSLDARNFPSLVLDAASAPRPARCTSSDFRTAAATRKTAGGCFRCGWTWTARRHWQFSMFFSNCCSNFWLISGKFWVARSLLYHINAKFCKSLPVVTTRLKALDEIYKIYTFLHFWIPVGKPRKATSIYRSALKNSAKCCQKRSQF